MRKFYSHRNIASFLFVLTFFIFVLAQRYTNQNGKRDQQVVFLKKTEDRLTENTAAEKKDTIIPQ